MKRFIPELAEICGIHAGDGYLRNDGKRRELDISGNIEERTYYENHIIPLFSRYFKLNIKGRYFKSRNTYGFVIRDPQVIEFMHNLGFPYGNKSTIVRIPPSILHSKFLLKYFLRGYFDTDGCLSFSKRYGKYKEFKKLTHNYPAISFSTVSKGLFTDLKYALIYLGFKPACCIYRYKDKAWNPSNRVFLYGEGQLRRWMHLIGIKNHVKLTRYEIWSRHRFCPTNITLAQRDNILNSRTDPYSFYRDL